MFVNETISNNIAKRNTCQMSTRYICLLTEPKLQERKTDKIEKRNRQFNTSFPTFNNG